MLDMYPNLIGCKVANYVFHFLQVLVAIATLVIAQCPIGWHGWWTNHFMVLTDDLVRPRACEEVEIQDSYNNDNNKSTTTKQ